MPTSAVAHGDPAERGAHQIHEPVVDSHVADGDAPVREEGIVLLDCRDDRVAQGEGGLGQTQHDHARGHVLPPEACEREVGQLEAKGHRAQLAQ
jgi:hypothetical protein